MKIFQNINRENKKIKIVQFIKKQIKIIKIKYFKTQNDKCSNRLIDLMIMQLE